jgi:cytoskeletal protein RodZ
MLRTMERTDSAESRVRARDAALRLLNRLTVGAAFAAVAGVGLFSAVSAATIPGTSSSTPTTDTSSSSSSSEDATSSSSDASSSSSDLQPSPGVSSSSGTGKAVTGASH